MTHPKSNWWTYCLLSADFSYVDDAPLCSKGFQWLRGGFLLAVALRIRVTDMGISFHNLIPSWSWVAFNYIWKVYCMYYSAYTLKKTFSGLWWILLTVTLVQILIYCKTLVKKGSMEVLITVKL